MKKTIQFLLAIVLCTVAATAHGALLFDNYITPWDTGIRILSHEPGNYVAQPFSLANESWLNQLTFNAGVDPGDLAVTSLSMKFYHDVGGNVGGHIADVSFIGSNLGTVTGSQWGLTLRDYSFALPDLYLAAGDYYVALHAEPLNSNLYWSAIASNPTPTRLSTDGGFTYGPYNYLGVSYEFEHALRLEGRTISPIPEPSTFILLTLGMLGLVGYARKKT